MHAPCCGLSKNMSAEKREGGGTSLCISSFWSSVQPLSLISPLAPSDCSLLELPDSITSCTHICKIWLSNNRLALLPERWTAMRALSELFLQVCMYEQKNVCICIYIYMILGRSSNVLDRAGRPDKALRVRRCVCVCVCVIDW